MITTTGWCRRIRSSSARELQYCQRGAGPVLLRVDTRAGHGMGKPARALAAEYADQLAFAAHHTGLLAVDEPLAG